MDAGAGPTTRRVRLDSEERRSQILQAATGLFLRRPYADVSITDIAEAAGVARGLLHHYFESKRALYL
ncbi:MAG TPA: helix-turn-helix domain-containing protein, partial [Acidimicrobiales bacterium]|nr:helix-turn-helix domain-containing protein [Acidimicrobiales bacterium]